MIETDRLMLRPVARADVDLVFDLFSDPLVAPWSGDGQVMTSRAQAEARVERYLTRGGARSWAGVFVARVRQTRADAGIAIVVPLPSSQDSAREDAASDDVEIGWHFRPSAWGHGYATEAGRAMAEHGFAHGCTELYAVTDPDNVRSQGVCRRLGMTDLGLRGDWYDLTLRAFRLQRAGGPAVSPR